MSKKVNKLTNNHDAKRTCDSCGKIIKKGEAIWHWAALIGFGEKTFCSTKCAKEEGFEVR